VPRSAWILGSATDAEKLSAVIPGRREAAGPESRKAGNPDVSGFRVRAFGAPRNDVRGSSAAC